MTKLISKLNKFPVSCKNLKRASSLFYRISRDGRPCCLVVRDIINLLIIINQRQVVCIPNFVG